MTVALSVAPGEDTVREDGDARDEWKTGPAAARYVGLSDVAFARRRQRGTGPRCYRRGRLFFYRTSDLDAWVMGEQ